MGCLLPFQEEGSTRQSAIKVPFPGEAKTPSMAIGALFPAEIKIILILLPQIPRYQEDS